jgi:CHAD domain-containing protein
MRAFTVTYSGAKDETKVSFSQYFEEADSITKLDILKDAMGDLRDVYNKALSQYSKELSGMGATPVEENA